MTGSCVVYSDFKGKTLSKIIEAEASEDRIRCEYGRCLTRKIVKLRNEKNQQLEEKVLTGVLLTHQKYATNDKKLSRSPFISSPSS